MADQSLRRKLFASDRLRFDLWVSLHLVEVAIDLEEDLFEGSHRDAVAHDIKLVHARVELIEKGGKAVCLGVLNFE